MANEFGDYQTPVNLVEKVLNVIKDLGFDYPHVVEPTFGIGNFLSKIPVILEKVKSISGFEINKDHYSEAVKNLSHNVKYDLHNKDFFTSNVSTLFSKSESNLVVGNLPWVTVSQLSEFESQNIPKKSNIKGLRGYDALTGKSNFDIAEYMCLSMLNVMQSLPKPSALAVLVKNIVAKNILKYLPNSTIKPSTFKIFDFDAKKEFNVAADACLMVISFGNNSVFNNQVEEYSLYNCHKLIRKFGWYHGKFVSNVSEYINTSLFDNKTSWDWRSGVKHDASKVMELKLNNATGWTNGLHETYSFNELDDKYIYPLVKSSDVRKQLIHKDFRKYVIVTQKAPKEDTSHIKYDSPSMWNYLVSHKSFFDKRKSSIYRNAPDFSMFGIGPYTLKKYKVAISGMYKNSRFAILPEKDGKPIMADDTVYFVGFDDMEDAKVFCATLNSDLSQTLLKSLVFKDEKRPYKKELLKRIDVIEIIKHSTLKDLSKNVNFELTSRDIEHFLNKFDTKPMSS